MNELFEASLRFPTVVFTIGLGIVLVYWLFVLLGALDIDLLGGGDAGGHDFGGHEIGGGHDVGGHDVGGDGGDVDGDAGGEGLFAKLGLGVVPITITVSLIMLVGWTGSLLLMFYAGPATGDAAWLPFLVLPGMLIAGMIITGVLVRPLAPVFAIREGKTNRDYVGHTCTITTSHVDDKFGHASVEDGGTTLDIPVRCDRPGVLARTDKALIIDFDEERQAYLVEPITDMVADSK